MSAINDAATPATASPLNFLDLADWNGLAQVFKKDAHPGLIVLFYTSARCGFCSDAETEFRPLIEENQDVFFVRLDVGVPGRGNIFGVPGTTFGRKLEGTPSFFLFKDTQYFATVVGAGKMDELRSLISDNKGTPSTTP